MWKNKMNECNQERSGRRRQKKAKIDDPDVREQCRISCGAGIVIEHVLPYISPEPIDGYTCGIADSDSGSDDGTENDVAL